MKKYLLIFLIIFCPLFADSKMIVGIAGGTSSGKTRIAKILQEAFPSEAVLISQDSYYKDLSELSLEERAKFNFDHPDSIDFDLLMDQLIDLKNNKPILEPIYDFKTHSRTSSSKLINPTPIIIVEGILLLSVPELRDFFNLKIFVEAEDDIRVLRRIERDISERGRTFESVKNQYLATVKPMHKKFVEPSKEYADVIVPSTSDNSEAIQLIISHLKECISK